MPYSEVLDIEEKSPSIISALLEEYYKDRDSLAELEEVLDIDLEYDIVFKKTFSRIEYTESGNVDENSYSYDYAGNIIRSVKKYEDDLSVFTDYRAVRVIKPKD